MLVIQELQVNGEFTRNDGSDEGKKLIGGGSSHASLVRHHIRADMKLVYVVLVAPVHCMDLEEHNIGVSLSKPRESSTLMGDLAVKGSEAKVGMLELSS